MNAQIALLILDLLDTALTRQADVSSKINQLTGFLQTLIEEGREPTQEEIDALRARLAQAEHTLEQRAEDARNL